MVSDTVSPHQITNLLQRRPDLVVPVFSKRINVPPDRPGEDQGILRDDGEAPPQEGQAQLLGVDAVNQDVPFEGQEAEEDGEQGGLAGAGAAGDAQLKLCRRFWLFGFFADCCCLFLFGVWLMVMVGLLLLLLLLLLF
jgi:hypothetical protein